MLCLSVYVEISCSGDGSLTIPSVRRTLGRGYTLRRASALPPSNSARINAFHAEETAQDSISFLAFGDSGVDGECWESKELLLSLRGDARGTGDLGCEFVDVRA